MFSTPSDIATCPLCEADCPGAYFAHLLSPRQQLELVLNSSAGKAFHALLRAGYQGFALYVGFSVFALALHD